MRILLFLACLILTLPAMAQQGDPIGDDGAAYDQRLALALKMNEIWPIRLRIETAIAAAAESFPLERRPEVKAALRKNIQFDQIEEESIKAMAETFSSEELQAMIDFYGSENGRSISAKTSAYEHALRPSLIKMMDKAMLDVKTGKKP